MRTLAQFLKISPKDFLAKLLHEFLEECLVEFIDEFLEEFLNEFAKVPFVEETLKQYLKKPLDEFMERFLTVFWYFFERISGRILVEKFGGPQFEFLASLLPQYSISSKKNPYYVFWRCYKSPVSPHNKECVLRNPSILLSPFLACFRNPQLLFRNFIIPVHLFEITASPQNSQQVPRNCYCIWHLEFTSFFQESLFILT